MTDPAQIAASLSGARLEQARQVAADFWDTFGTATHHAYAEAIRRGERDECEGVQIAVRALLAAENYATEEKGA
jgi:hypothetical protein